MSTAPTQLPAQTLFLACTRPSMRMGVPVEGFFANVVGSTLLAMVIGRGNPAYYLIIVAIHIPLVILSDRNPHFFHEWKVWLLTLGSMVGNVLFVSGRENETSV